MKPKTKLVFLDTETTGLDEQRHEIFEAAWIVRDPAYEFPTPQPSEFETTRNYTQRRDESDEDFRARKADIHAEKVAAWQREKSAWTFEQHHLRWLWPDLKTADATALRFNNYYDRRARVLESEAKSRNPSKYTYGSEYGREVQKNAVVAPRSDVAKDLAIQTAGAHIVGFNPTFDVRFLEPLLRLHGWAPAWHYHLIDVEVMLATVLQVQAPWKSDDLIKNAKDRGFRKDIREHKDGRTTSYVTPRGEESLRHTAYFDALLVRDAYDWCLQEMERLTVKANRDDERPKAAGE